MDPQRRKLVVSGSPHTRSVNTVREIMLDVLIALAPAAVMGAYYFGLKAVSVMIAAAASAVLFEYLYERIMKKQSTIGDCSAIVTGVLLAFNLPASVPLWVPIVGSFFAIVVIKQLFGGLGQNFLNPALGARAFLLIAYPVQMTDWSVTPRGAIDALASATPLTQMAEGGQAHSDLLYHALIGQVGGCIGETCAVALIIGGVYLIARKVISWRIPVTYIAGMALLSWIFGRDGGFFTGAPLLESLMGGLLLGAFFMATDYSSSPVTPNGQLIMGFGCAILTVVIRIFGAYPEGVSFAILLMNLCVPLIDRYTKPNVFGVTKAKAKKEGGGGNA